VEAIEAYARLMAEEEGSHPVPPVVNALRVEWPYQGSQGPKVQVLPLLPCVGALLIRAAGSCLVIGATP
jgi:hypothetical protein